MRTASEGWSEGYFDFEGFYYYYFGLMLYFGNILFLFQIGKDKTEEVDEGSDDESFDEDLEKSMKLHDWNTRFQKVIKTLRGEKSLKTKILITIQKQPLVFPS